MNSEEALKHALEYLRRALESLDGVQRDRTEVRFCIREAITVLSGAESVRLAQLKQKYADLDREAMLRILQGKDITIASAQECVGRVLDSLNSASTAKILLQAPKNRAETLKAAREAYAVLRAGQVS